MFCSEWYGRLSALSPLHLSFPSKYVLRNDEENKEVMDLNRIHQVTVPADINLLGENVNSRKKIKNSYALEVKA
jgi:hypothetical protein